jgi:hypothetical protein
LLLFHTSYLILHTFLLSPSLLAQPIAPGDSAYRALIECDQPAPAALDLLLPESLFAGYQTRAWVRDYLPESNDSLSDLDRVDMIYLRALRESGGDHGRALLASLFAVFEHHTIPLSIGINLPLTLEPTGAFQRRVARLPGRLFADMPAGNDRDKLQHFFASAWLAWTLDGTAVADLIGLGIEVGEDAFVRGGANDRRDVRANRLGQHFAELLHNYPTALPSMLFRAWNREYERRR